MGSLGFAFFSLAMGGGRIYSDKLGEKYCRSYLLRIGGLLGAGGLGMSVLAPSLSNSICTVAFAVLGLTISGMHSLLCAAVIA